MPSDYPGTGGMSSEEAFLHTFSHPVQYNTSWTHQDERAFLARWNADPVSKIFKLKSYAGTTKGEAMRVLWIDSYRFHGCTPFDIISPDSLLEYDVSENPSPGLKLLDGREIQDPRWPSDFCGRLHQIIIHPFFKANKDLVVTTIQYAVICRENFTQKWDTPFSTLASNTFVERLRKAMARPENEGAPLPLVHQHVRVHMFNAQERKEDDLSSLFLAIENVAWDKKKEGARNEALYKVKVEDLDNLVKALDSLSTHGLKWYRPARELSTLASYTHSESSLPRLEDLDEYVSKVILDQRRKAEIVSREAPAQLLPVSTPTQPSKKESLPAVKTSDRQSPRGAMSSPIPSADMFHPKSSTHPQMLSPTISPSANQPSLLKEVQKSAIRYSELMKPLSYPMYLTLEVKDTLARAKQSGTLPRAKSTIVDDRSLATDWPPFPDAGGEYSGSGVDCLLVVLRRLYSHVQTPENWRHMLTLEAPDSFWLRYSWTRFGGDHAHNKKAIVRSLDADRSDDNDVPFRILAETSRQLDQYIWGTPVCSLFDPLVKKATSAAWKKLWDEDKQRYTKLMSRRSMITWRGPGQHHQTLNDYIKSLFVVETREDEEIMFQPNDGARFVRVLYDVPDRHLGDLHIEQRIKVPTSWMVWSDNYDNHKPRRGPGKCKITQSIPRNLALIALVALRGKSTDRDRVKTYSNGKPLYALDSRPYSLHWNGPKAAPGQQYMAYYADCGSAGLLPLGQVNKENRIVVEGTREAELPCHQPRAPSPDPYLGSYVPEENYYSPRQSKTSPYSHTREDEDMEMSTSDRANRHAERRHHSSPDGRSPKRVCRDRK